MSAPAQGTGRVELLDEIERFLRDVVESFAAKQPVRRGPGAPLVLPWLTLWVGLLLSVLRGFRSQSQLWRLLTQYGVWSYPRVEVCEQAVRNRLAQGGDQMERLFEQVSQVLSERLAPYEDRSLASFAKKVVAIDETKLDPLARKLPMLQGLRTEVAGRAGVSVFDVSMRLMIEALPQFALRGEDPVQTLVERGHDAKIIRPSRRLKMQAPVIEEDQITPVPEGFVFTRKARHANRKCGPRPPETRKKASKAKKPAGKTANPLCLARGQPS